MQQVLLILGFFLLLIPNSSGVEITSIRDIPDEINIKVGSSLHIPCHFSTDGPMHNHRIEMQWGMVPLEGGSFKSLVYLYHPETLQKHDSRARVFVSFLRHGNCSLMIDPVGIEDSGFFELHLSVDSNNYVPSPIVYVKVSEDLDQSYVNPNSRSLELNPETDNGNRRYPTMGKRLKYTLMLCAGGAILVVVLVASMGGIIYLELRRRKKKSDELRMAEEGHGTLKSPGAEMPSDDNATPSLADSNNCYKNAESEQCDMTQINGNFAPDVHITIPPEMTSDGLPHKFNVQVTYTCTCMPPKVEPSTSSLILCVPSEAALTQSAVMINVPTWERQHTCTCVPAKMCRISLLPPVVPSSP